MHFESNARNCEARATICMSHAHGAYVPPDVVSVASNAYVHGNNNNNNKKIGGAYGVVEPNKGR
jgi:hypothetical protein